VLKELMEFDYVEVDGPLYPRIEIDGKEVLDDLGMYGLMRWECKPGLYRELFFTGKLAEHCKSINELGFEMAEHICKQYIEKQQVSYEDFMEQVHIYTTALNLADEIVTHELVHI
jgi:hypothetical protein